MTEEDIIALIRQASGKSQDAGVRALYDLMAKPLLRFFVHMGVSPDEAGDLLQETFVKVIRSAGGFNPGGSAKAWLWQIARNCLTDYLRAKTRLRKHEAVFDDREWAMIEDTTPYVASSSVSVQECVSQGLARFAQIRPDCAYALTMQMEGMSVQDIAHQIGRTIAATKEYLSQCRKKITPFISHCADMLVPQTS